MQFQDVHSGYPLKGEGVKVTSCPVTSELLVRPGQQINLRWSGWSSLTGHKWGTLSGHRGPEFPAKGFTDLEATRAWAAGFVHWYNVEHRHSGIQYVSPAQRHEGQDQEILAARHELYTKARELNPARWSGKTRNWLPVGAVTLNPERDSVIRDYSADKPIQQLAA